MPRRSQARMKTATAFFGVLHHARGSAASRLWAERRLANAWVPPARHPWAGWTDPGARMGNAQQKGPHTNAFLRNAARP